MASKNKVNIDWGNGLSLVSYQITKTNVELLSVGPIDKFFNEILIKLQLEWADDPKVQNVDLTVFKINGHPVAPGDQTWAGPAKFYPGQVKIIIDYITRDFF